MNLEHISLDIRPILKSSDTDMAKNEAKDKAIAYWSSFFETHTGLVFNPLFFQAFTHRSFQNEYGPLGFSNYERLEFLGDSLLQTWVTTQLIKKFTSSEGKLSVLRSSIVNESSLAQLALVLGLEKLILLGKGEINSGGHLKASLLCDVFEALLGAHYQVYQDIEKTFSFLANIFDQARSQGIDLFDDENTQSFDDKTKLQNLVMKKFKAPPVYKTTQLDQGDFKYEVSLVIEEIEILKAQTNSIKQTQKQLAKQVLNSNLIQQILNPIQG